MANRWGNSGNSDCLFWGGSKITADGETKRCLLLGRKVMTKLNSILKSREAVVVAAAAAAEEEAAATAQDPGCLGSDPSKSSY